MGGGASAGRGVDFRGSGRQPSGIPVRIARCVFWRRASVRGTDDLDQRRGDRGLGGADRSAPLGNGRYFCGQGPVDAAGTGGAGGLGAERGSLSLPRGFGGGTGGSDESADFYCAARDHVAGRADGLADGARADEGKRVLGRADGPASRMASSGRLGAAPCGAAAGGLGRPSDSIRRSIFGMAHPCRDLFDGRARLAFDPESAWVFLAAGTRTEFRNVPVFGRRFLRSLRARADERDGVQGRGYSAAAAVYPDPGAVSPAIRRPLRIGDRLPDADFSAASGRDLSGRRCAA